VIWATGYRCDFGWIDIPVLDTRGEPIHRGGVADVPGLYFLGLPWLSKMNSSFLAGVGDDAERLAQHIVTRDRAGRLAKVCRDGPGSRKQSTPDRQAI
jgi:putative flavoprotein involved in K+ transport